MVAFLLFCVFVVIVALALAFARMSVLSTRLKDLENRLRTALGLIGELEKKIHGVMNRQRVTPKKSLRTLRKRL